VLRLTGDKNIKVKKADKKHIRLSETRNQKGFGTKFFQGEGKSPDGRGSMFDSGEAFDSEAKNNMACDTILAQRLDLEKLRLGWSWTASTRRAANSRLGGSGET